MTEGGYGMEMKFYRCKHCGQIVAVVKKTGVPIICCGEAMEEIVPGTTDAAVEKHVPVVSKDGDTVKVSVGSVFHPMLEEHYIKWVALETVSGVQFKTLKPGTDPVVSFSLLPGEEVVSCVAYCNLHGLWADK